MIFLGRVGVFHRRVRRSGILPIIPLVPGYPCIVPGYPWSVPGLSLLVPSQFQDVPDLSWFTFNQQYIKSPRDNDLIHISEKYLTQENFLFTCEKCQKSYL